MANFRTHVTTSTILGMGYAGAGLAYGVPPDTALVAGGMCGVAGMLPDVDSDSGIAIREVMAFAAAVVPMLMVDRFEQLGLSYEMMALAGGSLYILIRFGISGLLKRYTVHRGMFHSIPAALICAEIGFLIGGCDHLSHRYFKASAVLLGFLSHLMLDELYSMEWARGRWRFKKSFGTAMKLWGNDLWANVSTYAKLIVITALVLSEPIVMERLGAPLHADIYRSAQQTLGNALKR